MQSNPSREVWTVENFACWALRGSHRKWSTPIAKYFFVCHSPWVTGCLSVGFSDYVVVQSVRLWVQGSSGVPLLSSWSLLKLLVLDSVFDICVFQGIFPFSISGQIWCFIIVHDISLLCFFLLKNLNTFQFSSVAQSCPTLCDPMDCSRPGLPVHHQLPEFAQTHIHWVSDAIQPSHPLSSPSPPAFSLS